MIGGMRQKAMKGMVSKLIDGEAGDLLTGLIAEKEIELIEKVVRLHDVIGLDSLEHIPEKEDRKETMKGMIQALVSDDVPGFYFDEIVSENIDNAEQARRYLDLEGDEWAAEVDKIVKSYRKQGDERPRSAIVAHYINEQFDCSVLEFVTRVVIWKPNQHQNVASTVLLGNLAAVGQGIDRAADALEEVNQTDE
ncbi:hypothetical protein HALLA_09650 [Halostagnicola larsenii XH-48]|uniref:Uncharacterized protein n=1 Tax=Halostagnicola larsenii XH-48 TaxID=797299 RepID=W0JQH4_9EURY|nr:hypothetical protein [Halostagnicola larsenii]AHG00834.1 hypothetical protein HALLA_09485 [Halostagnicola larsenii XH-48]AHG00853.1 hypothetical protein HALLA_09650 [Halostagnicola larsenii XH-48]